MARPIKYFTEEERKQANRRSNTKYMINKEWLCPDCGNRDYSLAGKWTHLKSKNILEMHPKIKLKMRCFDHICSIFNIQEHECFRIF